MPVVVVRVALHGQDTGAEVGKPEGYRWGCGGGCVVCVEELLES